MEKGGSGGGGDVEPATSAAGGMCDRFLRFLAKNLSMSRMKSIAQGPSIGAGAGGGHPEGGADDGGVEEDEFAIPIERAEFDFQFGGHGDGGHSSGVAPTILEESAATTATKRDVPDDKQKDDGAAAPAAAAAAEGPAAPAVPAVEETKVRKTVTMKEDRPAQDGGASATATATATVERKKSLFRKRLASSVGAGEEQGGAARVPRRSGLRPRMPQVPRVPSNINERSSTFIEERKKSFGDGAKPAPEK